jgi:alanine racemase
MRPTIAEIDLAAIRHNVRQIRSQIGPKVKMAAVVKADAYGHGAFQVSRAALQAGADFLAVALPEEGAQLRDQGFTVPILVLGLVLPEQAALLVEHHLMATVSSLEQLEYLAGTAKAHAQVLPIFLKIDTGMGRIGITPDQVTPFLKTISQQSNIEIVGLFTHLASADADSKLYANSQLKDFRQAFDTISLPPGLKFLSAANSATIVDLPEGHFNTVRPGIILYGLPPSATMQNSLDLKPAMSLKTKIVYIKKVLAGTCISYGCTYTAASPTYIATLPLGYADGYNRLLSNKAQVLIGGRQRPVVGQICMDQVMVDLGPICDAAVGDEVVLFGRQGAAEITVTQLADLVGTINYELVCGISQRVPRVYLKEEDELPKFQ